jgi:23S rRNA pseudouridine1911/1915/1917 synthase
MKRIRCQIPDQMKTSEFIVRPHEGKKDLQEFLSGRLNLSRGKAKKLLDRRSVFVNRQRVWMARHTLQVKDVVQVVQNDPAPTPARRSLGILFDDGVYVVANKPAGMLSNDDPDSVESALRTQLSAPELEACHRLDRDTTGCLLFGRGRKACQAVEGLFRQHRVLKEYHTIVTGHYANAVSTVRTHIDHRPAVTNVRLLCAGREASHLLVHISTGRTHQIRRHLASTGHAVLGDREYGPVLAEDRRQLQVPRQMLHASRIEFEHPLTHTPVSASASLPGDFRKCLQIFRLS